MPQEYRMQRSTKNDAKSDANIDMSFEVKFLATPNTTLDRVRDWTCIRGTMMAFVAVAQKTFEAAGCGPNRMTAASMWPPEQARIWK